MGIFSRFEGRMEDSIEGAANKMFDAPISPVQISKKAEKAMRREKMVGAGRQYAPTLYTVLVNPDDDQRLFGYYPTLAGETETYLAARAQEEGLAMDGQPLVRFIVDDSLRRGKFDIIAEMVSAPIIAQLRQEEMARYGIAQPPSMQGYAAPQNAAPQQQAYQAQPAYDAGGYEPQGYDYQQAAAASADRHQPLPYVPQEEIDYSIDYGEYTFDSQDWDSYGENGPNASYAPAGAGREDYGRRNSQPFEDDYDYQDNGADMSGLNVDTYEPDGAYDANAGFDNMAPAPAAGAAFASPAPAMPPMQAPGTAQFDGNVEPQPAQQAPFVPARLINTSTNRAISLDRPRMILGRSSASSVVLDDINASRSHAEVRFEPQGFWVISDLGSTNGTYVNDRRITTTPLSEGDRISIGMTTLMFTLR